MVKYSNKMIFGIFQNNRMTGKGTLQECAEELVVSIETARKYTSLEHHKKVKNKGIKLIHICFEKDL